MSTTHSLDTDLPSEKTVAVYHEHNGIVEKESGSYYISKTNRIVLSELARYVSPDHLERYFSNAHFRHGLKRYLKDCLLKVPFPLTPLYVHNVRVARTLKTYTFGFHSFGLISFANIRDHANAVLIYALFDYIGHAETMRRSNPFYSHHEHCDSHVYYLSLRHTGFDISEFDISELLSCLFKRDVLPFLSDSIEPREVSTPNTSQSTDSTTPKFRVKSFKLQNHYHGQYDKERSIKDVVTCLDSLKIVDSTLANKHTEAHQQGFCVIMNTLCDRDFDGKINAIADELLAIQHQEIDYAGILARSPHGARIAQYDEEDMKDTCMTLAEHEFLSKKIPLLSDAELCELFRQLLFYYPKHTGNDAIDLHNECIVVRALELIYYERKDLYPLEFKPLIYHMLHNDGLGCKQVVDFSIDLLSCTHPEERALATMDYLAKSRDPVLVRIAQRGKRIILRSLEGKQLSAK